MPGTSYFPRCSLDAGHEGIHKKIARDYTFAFREEHSIHYMQIVVNERYEY